MTKSTTERRFLVGDTIAWQLKDLAGIQTMVGTVTGYCTGSRRDWVTVRMSDNTAIAIPENIPVLLPVVWGDTLKFVHRKGVVLEREIPGEEEKPTEGGKSITITRRSPATAISFVQDETGASDRQVEAIVAAILDTNVGWIITRENYIVSWMIDSRNNKRTTITIFRPTERSKT